MHAAEHVTQCQSPLRERGRQEARPHELTNLQKRHEMSKNTKKTPLRVLCEAYEGSRAKGAESQLGLGSASSLGEILFDLENLMMKRKELARQRGEESPRG